MRGDLSGRAEDAGADRVANGNRKAEAQAENGKQGRLANGAQVRGQRCPLPYTVASACAYSKRDFLAMTGVPRSSSHSNVGFGTPSDFKSHTEYALLLRRR